MNKNKHTQQFCGRMNRRESIRQLGGGFAAMALTGLLSRDNYFVRSVAGSEPDDVSANPLAAKVPELPARAKSCIFIFCYGGPSHIETFEYKPKLYPLDGKTIKVKTFGRGGKRNEGRMQNARMHGRPAWHARLRAC